jgi:hypothetical protein
MLQNRQQLLWVTIPLLLAVVLWVLNIELTDERNVRRGIPADFRIHDPHRSYNWRA